MFGLPSSVTAQDKPSFDFTLYDFPSVLGYYNPDSISVDDESVGLITNPDILLKLGAAGSAVQAAAANEIANLAISAAGTQYFFGRDRMFYISGNLGTYFIEPPWTNGAGNFSFGVNTAFLDFQTIHGVELDDVFDFVYEEDGLFIKKGDKVWDGSYDLTGEITSLSLVYGLTKRLDLGIIVPLVHLEGEGTGDYRIGVTDIRYTDFKKSITDIADIFLRLKYQVMEVEDLDNLFGWTLGLDFKLDNGNQDKLLGTGDLGYRIRSAVGKRFGPCYPVVEVAYNFAGVDARNAINIIEPTDVLGQFQLVSASTGIHDSDFDAFELRCGLPVMLFEERWTMSVEWLYSHSNFATKNDLGVAARVKLTDQFYMQGGVRIPLDDDGLRTDFIPTFGLEYRF